MASSQAAEMRIISTVPVANGIGASTAIAASVSTPARPTRSPSGRRWCHEIGWRTSRSTTPRPSEAPTRNWVIPANTRRITTPAERTTPTTRMNKMPAATVVDSTSPSSNRGTMTWSITQRRTTLESTVQIANTADPPTAVAKTRGWRLTIALIIRNPRRSRAERSRTGIGSIASLSTSNDPAPADGYFPARHTGNVRPVEDQLNLALLVLRVFFGLGIAYHGYNHAFGGGKLAGTARWFGSIGMKWPEAQARLSVVTEVGAGFLFAAGLITPFAAAGMIGVMVVAFWTVHRFNGFFIIKEGWEYVASISLVAWAVATVGPGEYSLDHALDIDWTGWTGALIAALLGVGGAAVQLAVCYRRPVKAGA